MAQQKKSSNVTIIKGDVRKADTKALITNGTDSFPEDSFAGSYMTSGATAGVAILEPTYKPGTLKALTSQNNVLLQCIEAMEVNIDGTGHSIDLIEGATENEAEKTRLESFFKEPYPGKSWVSIRREIRNDLEASGNGYLEIIRNALDEVVMANYLEGDTTRLVRFDDAVVVPKSVVRDGKDITVNIRTRERRYVQIINGKKVYFKEFGASRQLDRDTGEWATAGTTLPLEKRASEVIHFTLNKEPKTPYGSPRWINQLPSVLGSRKAEEHNLEFFDAGGLPPVLVIVQGGTLGDTMREELQKHLSGKGGSSHRAAIVEAISTSGSLDSAGSVQVRVERFGAERQSDAMFQNYDANCEEHVRVSFRLPPIFIGKSQDYNFATAYTAYMVAEAQVFAPERYEFDDRINNSIVKSLGAKSYIFRSLPVTLTDVEKQLAALGMVAGKNISGEQLVKSLNEITGLGLEFEDQAEEKPKGKIDPLTGLPYTQPAPPPVPASQNEKVKKEEHMTKLLGLVSKWANVLGLEGDACLFSESEKDIIWKEISSLDPEDSRMFNEVLATKSLVMTSVDPHGLGELCGCAGKMMEKYRD